MSFEITTAFVQQFNSNVYHLAQQEGSVLAPAVRKEMQRGKAQFWDRIGPVSVQQRTTRHGDTPQIDTPHSRRMVTLKDYEWADLIDDQDKLRTLIDPANPYVQEAANAFGRQMDVDILKAAVGSASTGEDGSTSTALTNAQKIIPVSGSAHADLNVLALRKAAMVLNKGKVPNRIKRYIALNAQALDSLLAETETTSSDYNTVKALVRGDIDEFMGFKFIRTEEIQDYSASSLNFNASTGLYDSGGVVAVTSGKSVVAWAEDGLLLAVGQAPKARISERDDKGYATQAYMSMSIGSVRMEEAKVVQIIVNQ